MNTFGDSSLSSIFFWLIGAKLFNPAARSSERADDKIGAGALKGGRPGQSILGTAVWLMIEMCCRKASVAFESEFNLSPESPLTLLLCSELWGFLLLGMFHVR